MLPCTELIVCELHDNATTHCPSGRAVNCCQNESCAVESQTGCCHNVRLHLLHCGCRCDDVVIETGWQLLQGSFTAGSSVICWLQSAVQMDRLREVDVMFEPASATTASRPAWQLASIQLCKMPLGDQFETFFCQGYDICLQSSVQLGLTCRRHGLRENSSFLGCWTSIWPSQAQALSTRVKTMARMQHMWFTCRALDHV